MMLLRRFPPQPALALLACLAAAAPAPAADAPPPDEVVLQNGSKILGTITASRDGKLKIETDFAGTLTISLDQVQSMRTAEPVVIKLADDQVISGQPLQVEDDKLVLSSPAEPARTYAVDELLVVNPEPWELGIGHKWTGLVSFAMTMQRGNTDTDELDYKLETVWRSQKDRYTLRLNGELDEADGQKNADNWMAQGKYDYFVSDRTYYGFSALAEHDKFTDLDLRYVLGPYIGRQFYDDPVFTLAGELGLSYVDEDYIVAEDDHYVAATWEFRASSNYLGGDSRLYVENNGLWDLEETSDYIVNTIFGLSFPLLWSLEAAAEILLEYDAGAVAGVDKLDETYSFRIGYTW
ncbi:MAG: DUF481 domain-containing protein [Halioglobus sp.]|nr:DUF481 domain-containing protein [Halioglobus sp.]